MITSNRKVRSIYIYKFGEKVEGKFQYSLDFYGGKGKDFQYVYARTYWVDRLKEITHYMGGNTYVEKIDPKLNWRHTYRILRTL